MKRCMTVIWACLVAAACTTTGNSPDDLKRTWNKGIHGLPVASLQPGASYNISTIDKHGAGWASWVGTNVLKPGETVPAVIYLHGCTGLKQAGKWSGIFREFGFAFFAPDSFQRAGRTEQCRQGNTDSRIAMRTAELENALRNVRRLPWIEQDRIVLAGYSEGGHTVCRLRSKRICGAHRLRERLPADRWLGQRAEWRSRFERRRIGGRLRLRIRLRDFKKGRRFQDDCLGWHWS